jgi:hypothetical protein
MTPFDSPERVRAEARAKSGAAWFYWIAGLSLITSLIVLAGGSWGFIASLGVTQIINALANVLAQRGAGAAKIIALVFDAVAAGVFVLIGYFAMKRHSWAFIVGLALYVLDALLFILVRHWLGLAFHAYVTYCLFAGYKACSRLAGMDREAAAGVAADVPAASGV